MLKILLIALLCGVPISARSVIKVLAINPPPSPEKVAAMARYLMHNSDWVSIATLSTQDAIKGYPFVSLKSVSDGPVDNSTGIPFLYMTEMDVSGKDVESDNRVTIMTTLAESDYCKTKDFDPQDPRCAKLIITGRLMKVPKDSADYQFAENSLFARHPSMKYWPKNHKFYVARVDIEQIAVLDYFGGIKHVSKTDYFNAPVAMPITLDSINNDIDFTNMSFIVDIQTN